MKHFVLILSALFFSCASFACPPLVPIVGDSIVCVGGTITLNEPSIIISVSMWSSSDASIASVSPVSGPTTTVTGIAPGIVTITYTSGSSSVTKSVTVDPAPSAITGVTSLCAGMTALLTDAPTGGTWTSSAATVAAIGSSSGLLTGIGPGTTTITYSLAPGCMVTTTVTVGATAPIVGSDSLCVTSTTTLTDATTGGAWSSSDPSVATIGSSSGLVTGIAIGTTTIAYTPTGGCPPATMTMTIITTPAAVTGPTDVCPGSTITLSDAGGGTWVGSPSTTGSIGSSSGIVTGIAPGTFLIIYSLGAGCNASYIVTVDPTPTSYTVTGGGSYCAGGTGEHVGLSGSSAGVSYQLYLGSSLVGSMTGTGSALDFGLETAAGTYTVVASGACAGTMTGSATITINPLPTAFTITGGGSFCAGGTGADIGLSGSASGVSYQLFNGSTAVGSAVTGIGSALDFGLSVTAGTYTIVATDPSTGCTNTMTGTVTITINPSPAAIAGTPIICTGLTRTYTDATTGGAWSSSTAAVATVGSSTGIATGVAAGTDTIRYTITATGCSAAIVVTVTPTPCSSTGINETTLAEGAVNIYPNPATDELTIEMNKDDYSSFSISNSLGQVLIKQSLSAPQSNVHIAMLAAGMYYITLKGSNGNIERKFVKM